MSFVSANGTVQETQRYLRHENNGVRIIVTNYREEGILGPVGPAFVKGAEDPVSLDLEHRLVKYVALSTSRSSSFLTSYSVDRLIEAVKDTGNNTFLSPLWEMASFSLGLAPATSARTIEVDITGMRKLLNVSSGNTRRLIVE